MDKEKMQEKLNNEYKQFGTIEIRKMELKTVDVMNIEYIESIFNNIVSLDSKDPIVLSKDGLNKYKIIDGYHRFKYHKDKSESKIKAYVLNNYYIKRKTDTLFQFLSGLVGKTLEIISDEVIKVGNDLFFIKTNEGCGGCGNGWSSIDIDKSIINKKIKIKKIEQVFDKEDKDIYKLFINGEIVANVNTGWGNGYYGGDFVINAIK